MALRKFMGIMVFLISIAAVSGVHAKDKKSFLESTKPQSDDKYICRLIDFNEAKLITGIVPKTWFLIVSGEKPYVNMHVKLKPLVYVQYPDWWGIEVIGCLGEIGLPAFAPYSKSLDVTSLFGKYGIEVIGANNAKKIKRP